MKIRLLTPVITVDGVRHEAGEVIDVDDGGARCLIAIKSAEYHIEKKTKTPESKEE